MAKKKDETPDVAVKPAEDSMIRIVALVKARDQAQAELEAAEADVRIKRKGVERANLAVFQAVREESQPSLFSEGIRVSDEAVAAARAEIDKPEAAADTGPASEEWKKLPLSDLGLGKAAYNALTASKTPLLVVAGDLCDFVNGGGDLLAIEGVTKSSAKAIDAALQQFLAKAAK